MLSREIATQMRGRALTWEMFPFSFREFLDFKGIGSEGNLSTKQRLTIQHAFGEYWQSGGFPEVAGLNRQLRIKAHQEYWGAMLFRDLIERHDISHPKAVTDLAHWLVDNTASLARANTNPKKIYCIGHALVTSVSSGILINSGHLLENLIFNALRRVTPDIFYYKTKSGREVDFIVQQQDRSRMLVQVCESMAEPKTRKREVMALTEAMAELQLTEGVIVTRSENELIQTESGSVAVIPAWRFLLNIS